MKIAVSVHLYHLDMWERIQKYLENLDQEFQLLVNIPINELNGLPVDFDWVEYMEMYTDLKLKLKNNETTIKQHFLRYGRKENRFYTNKHLEIANKIKKFKPSSIVFYTSNIGMDIGGFLQAYKKIDGDVNLILKIHTKKCLGSFEKMSYDVNRYGFEKAKKYGENWFDDLMCGVLKSTKQVEKIINEFKINKKCGMVGYKKYNNYKKNSNYIQKLFEHFLFSVNLTESYFVGGTIFWVRKDILDKYFTIKEIDYLLGLLSEGYIHEPSYAHAMERAFAYFVYHQNSELFVID
jgi:lipopolysaccharide biosynthesis protein